MLKGFLLLLAILTIVSTESEVVTSVQSDQQVPQMFKSSFTQWSRISNQQLQGLQEVDISSLDEKQKEIDSYMREKCQTKDAQLEKIEKKIDNDGNNLYRYIYTANDEGQLKTFKIVVREKQGQFRIQSFSSSSTSESSVNSEQVENKIMEKFQEMDQMKNNLRKEIEQQENLLEFLWSSLFPQQPENDQ